MNNKIGNKCNDITSSDNFKNIFNSIQLLIRDGLIFSGHDISSGGILVSLLEMCFVSDGIGLDIDLSSIEEEDIIKLLFSENHGIIFQANNSIESHLNHSNIKYHKIGSITKNNQ